jgi:hypothetical protein
VIVSKVFSAKLITSFCIFTQRYFPGIFIRNAIRNVEERDNFILKIQNIRVFVDRNYWKEKKLKKLFNKQKSRRKYFLLLFCFK